MRPMEPVANDKRDVSAARQIIKQATGPPRLMQAVATLVWRCTEAETQDGRVVAGNGEGTSALFVSGPLHVTSHAA
jgi:hypothetical protein